MKKYIFNKIQQLTAIVVYSILPLAGGGWMAVSCSDMFETESDRQIFDPQLDEKTDSMFYTLGILKGLQDVADQYVLQGEMRGDLVATNQYSETDLKRLANFTANDSCKYDSAYLYYRIINNCNYYIAHRDTTLRTGDRKVAMLEYVEAHAVRAWAYLQLCRNYGEVPFYTDPITSIGEANKKHTKYNLQQICDVLIPDLVQFSGTPVPTYGSLSAGVLNGSGSSKSVTSSRCMIPVDVILGDLYLETHRYNEAAHYYFRYLADNEIYTWPMYINPLMFRTELAERYPANLSSFTYSSTAIEWTDIFYTNGKEIITYIPLAANRLRGTTTELPRLFGYDFYSTTGGSSNSSARYLLERQIDASPSYIQLSESQQYYYKPSGSTGQEIVSAEIGDLRRLASMTQVSKSDSTFRVMVKFNYANVPIYRTAGIYLRLAEAVNRMGYPDAAFAIMKDGISSSLSTYVLKGDSTDIGTGRYIRQSTYNLLKTTLPFLSDENIEKFTLNYGIHSRGTNETGGTFSPYQMDTIVGKKIADLEAKGEIIRMNNINDTINAVEDLICDEMALELAFEGSRFGDITRIARHKNEAGWYGSNYGSRWLANKLAYKKPQVDITDENNWYLPFK